MSSSAATNGTTEEEPGPKRRKLLDAGGPIEDDETARQKMRDARVYERGVDGTYGEYESNGSLRRKMIFREGVRVEAVRRSAPPE